MFRVVRPAGVLLTITATLLMLVVLGSLLSAPTGVSALPPTGTTPGTVATRGPHDTIAGPGSPGEPGSGGPPASGGNAKKGTYCDDVNAFVTGGDGSGQPGTFRVARESSLLMVEVS